MDIYDRDGQFLDNKYTKWYYNIINSRKQLDRFKSETSYYENHHIIPKCKPFNGRETKQNMILLTYKEHFLVHWLLTKMCIGHKKRKMCNAMARMGYCKKTDGRIICAWQYQIARKLHIDSKRGKSFVELYGVEKAKEISDKLSNISDENREKRSKARRGVKATPESIKNQINAAARIWIFIDSYNIKAIKNLNQYCKNKKISSNIMSQVSKGKYYKGYKIVKLIQNNKISTLHCEEIINNLNEYFTKFKNLSPKELYKISNGILMYPAEFNHEEFFNNVFIDREKFSFWLISDPNKNLLVERNISKFCNENNLDTSSMIKTSNCKGVHCKNYRCERLIRIKYIPKEIEDKIFEDLNLYCLNYNSLTSTDLFSLSQGNLKFSEYHEKLKSLEFKYKIISPQDIILYTNNLPLFCKENTLSITRMRLVYKGKQNSHKGWKCELLF